MIKGLAGSPPQNSSSRELGGRRCKFIRLYWSHTGISVQLLYYYVPPNLFSNYCTFGPQLVRTLWQGAGTCPRSRSNKQGKIDGPGGRCIDRLSSACRSIVASAPVYLCRRPRYIAPWWAYVSCFRILLHASKASVASMLRNHIVFLYNHTTHLL